MLRIKIKLELVLFKMLAEEPRLARSYSIVWIGYRERQIDRFRLERGPKTERHELRRGMKVFLIGSGIHISDIEPAGEIHRLDMLDPHSCRSFASFFVGEQLMKRYSANGSSAAQHR